MAYLNEIWFILVAVLFVGFFFLEGFDFGVGMSMQLLGKDAHERRILINTIGPFWD
ncbi:MAG: cytochrome d ubiquinol oxidase subunit II, partial [Bacillus sp. (in: Bacteria)]|nr:cytochrome d ubiquinol oxidase subunit II [Bacillus sp. (in: firmicutes)]